MNKIYFLFYFLSFTLQSCIVPQFAEPQPAGVKHKNCFPSKLWGRYNVTLLNMSAQPDNQSSIIIDSTHLSLYEARKIKVSLSDVKADSNTMLIDGYIYIKEKSETKVNPYKLINDTIYYTDSNTVELSLSGNCIFKEWKGHYFLNRKREKYWDVLLMDQQPDNNYTIQALILSEKIENESQLFSDPSEIPIDSFYYKKAPPEAQKPDTKNRKQFYLEDLEKITSCKKEGTEYIIKPSKSQLMKLIRKKFFKEVWRIEKVK
ncbi:MAG TPA: hypothetical protein VNW99_14170 [Cytophagaceae bacterium]|nr:hypothetical protein [Cytophagaceae bacterium]